MSLTTQIYDAFCVKVQEFADAQNPPLFVAYPNLHSNAAHHSGVIEPWGEMVAGIDPWGGVPAASMWLGVLTFWNESQNYGLDIDGPTIERGFFRAVVVCNAGIGIMGAQEVAESILQHFKKGNMLGPARIEQMPYITGPIQEGERSMTPVTVRWRATR